MVVLNKRGFLYSKLRAVYFLCVGQIKTSMPEARAALSDSATHELLCAQRIVAILFERTGLADVVGNKLTVTVGRGNWVSFFADRPVSSAAIRDLKDFAGLSARHAEARSKSSPSLHLVNVGSAENLRGHVDAHYWARNPLGHVIEFLTKRTVRPSQLLESATGAGPKRKRRPTGVREGS